jgi:ferredoxin
MLRCNRCVRELPAEAFYAARRYSYGRVTINLQPKRCRACHVEANRDWRARCQRPLRTRAELTANRERVCRVHARLYGDSDRCWACGRPAHGKVAA